MTKDNIYQNKIIKISASENESLYVSMGKNKIRLIILFFLLFPSCFIEGCACSCSEYNPQSKSGILHITDSKIYEDSLLRFINVLGYKTDFKLLVSKKALELKQNF